MNHSAALFFGSLPAVILSAVFFFRKRRLSAALLSAFFCVTAAAFLFAGLSDTAGGADMSPDELLEACLRYLEPDKSAFLPEGFVSADSRIYERVIRARPDLGPVLGPERDDPAAAEFCRRLRNAAALCGDTKKAYITLARLEFRLGHTAGAEAALGKAFPFVPESPDIGSYPDPGFDAFAGDYAAGRGASYDIYAQCPPSDGEFALEYGLVYLDGREMTLGVTGRLPDGEAFVLLEGRRKYMLPVTDGTVTLPADTEDGEYIPIISDGVFSSTSIRKFHVTHGMTETAYGEYVFSSCAEGLNGLTVLGGRLHFDGDVTVSEKDGAISLSFESAFVLFDESSPLSGGALTVTPRTGAVSADGGPFVFVCDAAAGSVRLNGVTAALYPDHLELTRSGKSSPLSEALSHLISDSYISADISGAVSGGKLFMPLPDTLPPLLEITEITEESPYYIITGMTEKGSLLLADGKSAEAGDGSFSIKTPAAARFRLKLTAEDTGGNRTGRELLLVKEQPVRSAFSLYSKASFAVISALAAVYSTTAVFLISDEETKKAAAKHRRRILTAAAVFCAAAAGSLAIRAFTETEKIMSESFFAAAQASPAGAYELIKNRDGLIASAILLTAACCLFTALAIKNRRRR